MISATTGSAVIGVVPFVRVEAAARVEGTVRRCSPRIRCKMGVNIEHIVVHNVDVVGERALSGAAEQPSGNIDTARGVSNNIVQR